MKKKIIISSCFLLAGIIGISLNHSTKSENFSPKVTMGLKEKEKVAEVTKMVIKAQIATPSIEEYEKDYSEKSESEIRKTIAKNNEAIKEKNLIAKANANELDQKSTAEFVAHMRLNTALHKILMERQIEELERQI